MAAHGGAHARSPGIGGFVNRIHLATALVQHDDEILLVASTYPNQPEPLWNLPGGRQAAGELLSETVIRALREETGLEGTLRELCYVSESYDGDTHFTNFTFAVVPSSREPKGSLLGVVRQAHDDNAKDHIVGVEWVPIASLAGRIAVAVVR